MPKLIDSSKFRKKNTFGPEEPPDVNLKTIENLKRRLKQETKHPCCKYQSELFIVNVYFI